MSSPYARPRLDRRPAAASSEAAAPAGPTIADMLADTDPAVLRIRFCRDRNSIGYHELTAYSAAFRPIRFDTNTVADRTIRASLVLWARDQFPRIDWRRDHDVHLACGHVRSTPQTWAPGAIPEDDFQFGGGPPVYVACGTAWADPTHHLAALAEIGATA